MPRRDAGWQHRGECGSDHGSAWDVPITTSRRYKGATHWACMAAIAPESAYRLATGVPSADSLDIDRVRAHCGPRSRSTRMRRGRLPADRRTAEQPCLAPQCDATQCSFRCVVVRLKTDIFDITHERVPLILHVRERLRQQALGQDAWHRSIHHFAELGQLATIINLGAVAEDSLSPLIERRFADTLVQATLADRRFRRPPPCQSCFPLRPPPLVARHAMALPNRQRPRIPPAISNAQRVSAGRLHSPFYVQVGPYGREVVGGRPQRPNGVRRLSHRRIVSAMGMLIGSTAFPIYDSRKDEAGP
jgi:hypothetical protein